jgi:plasmid stabilization system protein ParE
MKSLYFVAPQAAADLVEIWRYIKEHSSIPMANRVESVILEKLALLAKSPEAGPAPGVTAGGERSQSISQYSLYITATVKNGNDLQRFRFGPVKELILHAVELLAWIVFRGRGCGNFVWLSCHRKEKAGGLYSALHPGLCFS